MDKPLISIITVTYNAEKTVGRTLESVASQTFSDYEHVIIDGASTDGTLVIIDSSAGKDHRKVFSEPDKGLYDAMNKGLDIAQGNYVVFLNAGDKFHSESTLKLIAEAINEHGNPGVVYGQTVLVDNDGRYIAPRHLKAPENLTLSDFAKGMVVCHQAFVAKKSIVPFFSLRYRYSADYEWCIICLQHSKKNIYVGDVLIDYLIEGLSTANRRKSLVERFNIMSIYYGFWPTLWRHIGFVSRFLSHKRAIAKGLNS